MARIQGERPYVKYINGAFEKGHRGDTRVVARTVYGNTYANPVTYSNKESTAAQIAAQARFATASAQASTDMLNPEKKAEWRAIADASHGKYKTARGAAFAHYYQETSPAE